MRASAPVLPLGHAEPAFLLEEVEEHDLAHELLGEVHGVDALGLELIADGLVLGGQFFERRFNVAEQLGVLLKNSLVTASTLKASSISRQRGISLGVLEQIEKAGLRGVAAFALADDVGETPGRGEPRFHANLAGVFFDGGVFHLDVGEAPVASEGETKATRAASFSSRVLRWSATKLRMAVRARSSLDSVVRWTIRTSSFSLSGEVYVPRRSYRLTWSLKASLMY